MYETGDDHDDFCPRCGYDLRGLVLREGKMCPECAARVDAAAQRDVQDRRYVRGRIAWWAFVVASPVAVLASVWMAYESRSLALPPLSAWLFSTLLCAVAIGQRRGGHGRAWRWAWAAFFSFLYSVIVLMVLALTAIVISALRSRR